MSKALSMDLRDRVIAAVEGGDVVPAGGGPVRGQRVERDPLALSVADPGRCKTRASGRRPTVGTHRAPCRHDPGPGRAQERHHPGRASGGPGRAGCGDQPVEPVAVLRASPDHAQKSRHLRTSIAAPES
jgi:hypothetical protein